MIRIGLTGSIGMGKSTSAKLFAEAGIPVNDSDAVVHDLYNGEAVPLVEAAFPGSTGDGKVDRQKLSLKLAGDPSGFKRLEAIVHPLVHKRERRFLERQRQAGADMVVLDIPLLFETGAENRVDAVLVVSAPEEVQHARILARPNMTAAKLETILARQMHDADKRARADFVVDTSNGLESAREQIRHVLAKVATMPRRRS